MKARGRRGLIAAVALTAVIAIGCSPSAAGPSASSNPDGSGVTAPASQSALASPSEMSIPSPSAVDAATSALNGTYRWTMTKEDALAYAPPEDRTPEALATLPRVGTRILKDGTWVGDPGSVNGDNGTYAVDGNRVAFRSVGGDLYTFTYTADAKGDLTLVPVQPIRPEDAYIWSTEPWTKIQ